MKIYLWSADGRHEMWKYHPDSISNNHEEYYSVIEDSTLIGYIQTTGSELSIGYGNLWELELDD